MTFIQLIDYRTSRPDEVDRLLSDWIRTSEGLRTATRTRVGGDRDDPGHYVEILEFDSYEQAMRNSTLPQTQAIHEQFVPLCDGPPTFVNLDIVREERLTGQGAA